MAAKRLTLVAKTIRIKFKGPHVCYIKSKEKAKRNSISSDIFDCILASYSSQWQTFFKMAAKRLTLARKTIRTVFKGIHVCYAKFKRNANRTSTSRDIADFPFVLL